MKRVIILTLLALMTSFLTAANITLHSGPAKLYNSDTENYFRIKYEIIYNPKTLSVDLQIHQKSLIYKVEIDQKSKNRMYKSIEKFLEWEELASRDGDTIIKAIPNSHITSTIKWSIYERNYTGEDIEFNLKFFSTDSSNHQLVFNFITSDIGIEPLYLDKNEAEMLIDALNQDNMEHLTSMYDKYQ